MRTTYYVASSLDGFVATTDHKVDWLDCVADGDHSSYEQFFESVDGLVMGRATYDFVHNSGYPWHYGDKPCWLMTSRSIEPTADSVIPTQLDPQQIIGEAVSKGLSHLWVVGGGKVAAAFLQQGLLDSMIVSVIPVLLGDGIPLFDGSFDRQYLRLTHSEAYPIGLVQLTYDVRSKSAAGDEEESSQ